jgi:predicted Fe-Mo cluster-binding NifX family protein
MRIALAVWNGRISPVFDSSRNLLVVEIEGGGKATESEQTLAETLPQLRVAHLVRLGVQTLICGAITQPLAAMIEAADIRLIPFVAGDVRSVLEVFMSGNLPGPTFWMPGCGRGLGRWRGRGRRGGRWFREWPGMR